MPKAVRHQPGYTPEAANRRLELREAARKCGIKPRKWNRIRRGNPFSLDVMRVTVMDAYGALKGQFACGGIISRPLNERIPLFADRGGSRSGATRENHRWRSSRFLGENDLSENE